ncbi:MAG TPA: hypothetical protein VIM37_03975 [Candidatus Microsaccharimonas sp.]|jgi:hypothetical protein
MLTQKQKNRKTSKKLIIAIVTVVVLLLVAGTLVYGKTKLGWFDSTQPASKGTNLNPPTNEQKDNGTTIKQSNVDGKPGTGSTGNTDPGTAPSTSKSTVDVTITSPTSQSISNFSVRAYINKLTTDGSCTVTLTPASGTAVTKTLSGLQASNQISACPEFKFSSDQLSVGSWTLTVSYTSTDTTGTATQAVSIE